MTDNTPKDNTENGSANEGGEDLHSITHISGMYQTWFLDYASYVILERAVPAIEDGLKPVQRRILHSLWELEDGRYNKVANVIGNTMKYHPHGDASIGDAMVQLGQKDLLIDTQGNWGNIFTGDSAAAPRYIEARLSKFGLEVVFNPKTTDWGLSYDGRNKEPITLPVKFPLLLAQGVEGIAVGLACKILPHNFNELIDASIRVLQGKKTNIVPDFPTGGLADFTNYNDGLRGGKIRVRARINMLNKKTLSITEIPFGTTTTSLIDSILAANEKGKIKVRKIEDNTAEQVEILIHLSADVSPDKTIDALYAFTDCEVSISPNACIIEKEKPRFVGVNEILKISTEKTLSLLKLELEIEKKELEEKWHFASLEKIFIREEMYIDFKKYDNKEKLFDYLYACFKPHKKKLMREITDEDLDKLCQIPMIRITRFDSAKADDHIAELEGKIKGVKKNLANLVEYAIDYFKGLKERYGKGKERKTEIRSFENIVAKQVVVNNAKLYVNREEGFAGSGMRKDEFVCDCSDLDDIIAFRRDGKMVVKKIEDKAFFGKDIIYIAVFRKNDTNTVYHMIYRDGPRGVAMMKRFQVTGITRDKEYDLTKGNEGSAVLYFSANPNGETEIVTVNLKPLPGLRKLEFDLNFADLAIKGRDVQGNVVTKLPVKKIVLKKKGVAEIRAVKIWFDDNVHRLNTDEKGTYLGEFGPDDKILYVTQSGHYRVTGFDLSTHFDEDIILIEKFDMSRPVSCIYYDAESRNYMVKRFMIESASNNKVLVISEKEGSRMEIVTTEAEPEVEVVFRDKGKRNKKVKLADFIEVKGWKAKGNKLTEDKIKEINLLASKEGPRDLSAKVEEPEKEEKEAKKAAKESKKEKKPEKGRKGKGGKQATLF
ncbi:MAG: DNA gyrase/topoisomerase IV subunit A [Bacteroidota bacterium]